MTGHGKFHKFYTVFIALVLMIWGTVQVFAQSAEGDDLIYQAIDSAFASRSGEELDSVLKTNLTASDYPLYEAYILKKARLLIIDDELDFARQAALVVIDNNIENFDAVDLYSYIDKAILNDNAYKLSQENSGRQEESAQQKSKDKSNKAWVFW